PCLKQMVDAYNETGGNIVAVMAVPRAHTNRYGSLTPGREHGRRVDSKGRVGNPAPAKAPATAASRGPSMLPPRGVDHRSDKQKGAGGEIQLTDAMAKMIGHMPFHGFRFAGVRYDCGDKVGFLTANIALALDRADLQDGLKKYIRSLDLK